MVSIQLQCDSGGGVSGRWLSWARGCRKRVRLELWLGQIQALLHLEVAGDFLPKFAVPPGGQLCLEK